MASLKIAVYVSSLLQALRYIAGNWPVISVHCQAS